MRKMIDQRRSAVRTGPAGSDNGQYGAHGKVDGSDNPRLSLLGGEGRTCLHLVPDFSDL
jgi:hypothetical protein